MKNALRLFFLVVLSGLCSCKPQVPDQYLQPDVLEDILYDWHLADAMAETGTSADSSAYNQSLYHQAVLKKYNVTQAELDSSLVYYVRHADRLHKIYENLSKRLSDEAVALGATANDLSRYGDITSSRDTSNLWMGVQACVLMDQAPYNVMNFSIEADSSYHAGDKIIFSFNCDFIYTDGLKDGVAVLAVQFKNDSVAVSTTHMSSDMNYSLTVSDDARQGIKSIRGFIYLSKNIQGESSRGLKLMFIDNIRMVRMRAISSEEMTSQTGVTTNDTAKVGSAGLEKSGMPNGRVDASEPLNVPSSHNVPKTALRTLPTRHLGEPEKDGK